MRNNEKNLLGKHQNQTEPVRDTTKRKFPLAGEASTKKPKKEESNTSVIIIDDNGDDIEVMEKKEDVNHLIGELQRLIRAGESEKAAFVVRRLARMRLDLEISLPRPDKDATKVENKVTEETIKQPSPPPQPPKATKLEKCLIYLKTNYDDADEACIHVELEFDVLSTKVSELKEKISDLYGVVAHRQNLIINDCAANDADFLNAYEEFGKRKVNNGFASANAIEEDVYKIYVFINDDQQMADDAKRELVEDNHEPKRHKVELIEDDDENKDSFAQLAELYNKELNENSEPFACDICLDDAIPPKQGVILKECMHTFCKECLRNHINCCDDPVVKCPFRKDYNCAEHIQEREIRALLNEEEYEKFQMKSLRMSEAAMQNTFHCLTPDCIGFCVSEDNLNFYDCPVCEKVNCLRCNTIHMGKTCKEYQDDLKINAINDKNAKKDKEALEKLISTKKAMYCPGCKIILCKQTGCDWLQCPMCKMEICWATRGPRWGPNGRGDTSGGCKCNLAAGKPCTPNCGNCH